MKWSFSLGRFLGIEVFVHFTFLILLAFIGAAHWAASKTPAAALDAVFFFVLVFACVLLHEYGHALMARRFGIGTRNITVLPFGGVASLERMPSKPSQELWIALAGPAVNVVIATGLALWLALTGTWEPLSRIGPVSGGLLERLFVANVFLVLFNMLPAFPMDGGRVLRALLALRLDYGRATSVATVAGKAMAVIFAILGVFGNPMLLIIAVFVWLGASQEAAAVSMKSSFRGLRAGEAMVTSFVSLPPGASLGDVSRLMLSGSQEDFPIVEDGRVRGLVTKQAFFEAVRDRVPSTPLSEVMIRDFPTLEAGEMLDEAINSLAASAGTAVPVLHKGRLVGILTAGNIHELFLLRSAEARRNGYEPFTLRFPLSSSLRPINTTE